jgi:hypothetical protein
MVFHAIYCLNELSAFARMRQEVVHVSCLAAFGIGPKTTGR